jgi:hypothetical protein
VVLKLPVLPLNVVGLAQVPPVPPEVLNVAVTLRDAVMDNAHVDVPEQAPLQPAKLEPAAAAAVSVTAAPEAKLPVQVLPQLMPVGLEVTAPVPVPARVTASAKLDELLKVAVTARAAVIDTVQVDVPVHAPLQPAKLEPLAAAAVSVTEAPLAKFALHVAPQLMPPVFDVTVPEPVPFLLTVNAKVVELLLKVAVTERAAVIDTVQVLVPVHAPLQPAKLAPLAAAALSVTDAPLL